MELPFKDFTFTHFWGIKQKNSYNITLDAKKNKINNNNLNDINSTF